MNSDCPLYSKIKSKRFLNEKDAKIAKRSHAYKGYASTYSVKILNFVNPELQLKDTAYPIKNTLIDLLSELRAFKFVVILVLEFKKIKTTIQHLLFEPKSGNNYQWRWHWWCIWINL